MTDSSRTYNEKSIAQGFDRFIVNHSKGEYVRGEGLVGLTQAFLSAGARGVIASLWAVADRRTAELMEDFYVHLLREGMGPAQALRETQLKMIADGEDPYLWAPFIYQGNWATAK